MANQPFFDVLLRHTPPKPEAAAEAREQQRFLEAMSAEAHVCQGLADSDGWKHFISIVDNERRIVLAKIEVCQDPTSLAKLAGALLALEGFRTWPQDRVRELSQALAEASGQS